ncbi:protein takeout [Halyomorpha halys]|uniref:protein takeout n=1 Tax=Halyomorpha halys TaxID=286706 RepID=UPI0034D346B2
MSILYYPTLTNAPVPVEIGEGIKLSQEGGAQSSLLLATNIITSAMASHIINSILSFALFQIAMSAKLPSTFKKCGRTDPKFDVCLNDAIEDAIKILSSGIPKLGLVGLEPLKITHLVIGRGKGPISLDLSFKNLNIHGITDVKITDQKTNLQAAKLECKSFNKKLVLEGDYEVDGKILLLPIRGKGKDNVDGYSIVTGLPVVKKNKTYLEVKSFDYSFKPSRMRLQFDNLFNGEKQLSDSMNKILNDNWEEVLREMKPSFEEALSQIFRDYVNRLYQRVSLEELYPMSVKV